MRRYYPYKRLRPARRGAAMLIAMALILGLTALIASVQFLMASSFNTTKKERDYERALQMAEHGINMTIYNLNNNLGSTPTDLVTVPTIASFKAGVLAHTPTYVMTKYPANSTKTGYYVGRIGSLSTTGVLVAFGWSNGTIRRVKVNVDGGSLYDGGSIHTLNRSITNPNDFTTRDVSSSNYSLKVTDGAQVLGKVTCHGRMDCATNNASKFFVGPVKMSGTCGRFNTASHPAKGTCPPSAYPTYNPPSDFTSSAAASSPFEQDEASESVEPTSDSAANTWCSQSRGETVTSGVDYFRNSQTIGGASVKNCNNDKGLRYLVWDGDHTSSIRELNAWNSTYSYKVIQSGNRLTTSCLNPSSNTVDGYIWDNSDLSDNEVIYGVRCYPGDYYFDEVTMDSSCNLFIRSFSNSEATAGTIPSSGTNRPYNFGNGSNPCQRPVNGTLTACTSEATTRFWVGNPTSGTNNGCTFSKNVNMEYTAQPSRFRCYSANTVGVTISNSGSGSKGIPSNVYSGSSTCHFRGTIHGYNKRSTLNSGQPYGSITVTGNVTLHGAFVAHQASLGSATVLEPGSVESNTGDSAYYNVKSWTELP